ncbi:MAG TPA: serine/threonine-protein kinase, partial [Thermoanaerobaculia bacterium]
MTSDAVSTALAAGPVDPSLAAARFTPGVIIGGRYRIVSLLGRGGMGEVYGADDLKLGQRVALKFLPPDVARDRAARARLLKEVRIGREIAHPNVCRIYDVVEVEGHDFFSMELVDGEDLASLLRRIGRLPPDTALALARDLASGLAAAHDRGVIHRDHKPANVMIDGRGRARIMDFGLAAVAAELRRTRDVSGTPTYMAPEQLRGSEVTARSDVYGLGLILYEMFTGKAVFAGRSREALSDQHATAKTRPSHLAPGIDPEVEAIILRCIQEDPDDRFESAHAVVAALPGGDAIAAALAAGDTPSPDMVAVAGTTGELAPKHAWALAGGVLALILLSALVHSRFGLPGALAQVKPREVLRERAREMVATFGYGNGANESSWYAPNRGYFRFLARRPAAMEHYGPSQPSAIEFVYRDSPAPLLPRSSQPALITLDDPPENRPGMSTVILDHEGRLRAFTRVPPLQRESAPRPEFDWSKAFAAASLEFSSFAVARPVWTPPVPFDRQLAWSGSES